MARKARVEFYWTKDNNIASLDNDGPLHVVNWRLVGANGEIMCQSTQGFRDKTDGMRSVNDVVEMFDGSPTWIFDTAQKIRIVGPGRKPK